jgi:hypothetical protein
MADRLVPQRAVHLVVMWVGMMVDKWGAQKAAELVLQSVEEWGSVKVV